MHLPEFKRLAGLLCSQNEGRLGKSIGRNAPARQWGGNKGDKPVAAMQNKGLNDLITPCTLPICQRHCSVVDKEGEG
jgi:hypothetical protein